MGKIKGTYSKITRHFDSNAIFYELQLTLAHTDKYFAIKMLSFWILYHIMKNYFSSVLLLSGILRMKKIKGIIYEVRGKL